MKVLRARVKWYEEYSNAPGLQLLVDKLVDLNKLVYSKKERLYYAEHEGYVNFFYKGSDGRGYAGRKFTLKMEDGSTVVLKGPWSSRAGVMNQKGFGPCLDVAIVDDPKAFVRGYTFDSAAVTLEIGQQAAELAGVQLIEVQNDRGDITYMVFHPDRTVCKQCKEFSYDTRTKNGQTCRYCHFDIERPKSTQSLKYVNLDSSGEQAGIIS